MRGAGAAAIARLFAPVPRGGPFSPTLTDRAGGTVQEPPKPCYVVEAPEGDRHRLGFWVGEGIGSVLERDLCCLLLCCMMQHRHGLRRQATSEV